jgi:Domain of unknown function (DUF6438)
MSINANGRFRDTAGGLIFILMVVVNTSVADAACGRGAPVYNDIDAVRFERTNCFGNCPAYQVLLTKDGDCYYVGMRNVKKVGTYKGTCSRGTLMRAIVALRSHDFYTLNYDSAVLVLDAPHYIVSVERCGVTTILDWPAHEPRKDIRALLDDLDQISESIRWQKISDSIQTPLEDTATIP